MSDRDWRSERDGRADRNNNNSNEPSQSTDASSGGGGGGRYNRALQRRGTSPERLSPAEHDDAGGFYAETRHGNNDSNDNSYRQHQRPRYDRGYDDGGNNNNNNQWQQSMMTGSFNDGQYGFGMPSNMMGSDVANNNNFPFSDMLMPPQQPFNNGGDHSNNGGMMPFGAPGFDPSMMANNNNNNNNSSNLDPADLLEFLLNQQQQQGQQQQQYPSSYHHQSNYGGHASPMPDSFAGPHDGDAGVHNAYTPNAAPAASRVLPSVDEFVPVVPKSLLNLVRGGPTGGASSSSASPHPESGDGRGYGATSGLRQGANSNNSPLPSSAATGEGALVLLEAPKIAPEVERRGREQRRAHISGFPMGTTREELEHFFRLLLPEVRRLQTEREMHQLAVETGLLKEDGTSTEEGAAEAERHIPANANLSNIDELRDLTLSQGKAKPFSFIELRLADMVDELVQQCQADPHRFLFPSAIDGRVYPLTVRRPRDAEPLTGVELSKVVVIGFPLTISVDVIKALFESFGKLLTFELKNGYAYGEFAELRDATDFRADVHGQVLGNSMVVALPLYDWLKVLLVREGLDIPIADDDPVSGSFLMKQVRERALEGASEVGGDGQRGYLNSNSHHGGAGGGAGDGKSGALVLAEDPEAASLQIMRELLDMSFTLPDMLARFAALHPHLRPLYANTQVTVYPTPILVLFNLFDEEELVHDATYSTLLADIEEEVEKYGRVRQLIVPRREARPKLPDAPRAGVDYEDDDEAAKAAAMAAYAEAKKNFGAVLGRYMTRQTHPVWGGYGRVFVEYETVDEAAEAQQQIAGKLFGERTVVTSFLYPDLLKEDGEEEEEKAADTNAEAAEEDGEDQIDNADAASGAQRSKSTSQEKRAEAEPSVESVGGDDDDVAESATSEHAEDID